MADQPLVEQEVKNDTGTELPVSEATLRTRVGDVTEAAPGTDTASSGLNGRLQRLAQRLTSIFTAQSDGTQQTKIRGATDGTLIGNIGDSLKVTERGILATYSASVTAHVVATSPTDIILLKGSATKIVKVRRIFISGFQNNASYQDVLLIKRSADNTGGTRAAIAAVPYDSSDSAATAQIFSYTANPSALGTAIGTLLSLAKMFTGKNSAVGVTEELLRLASPPQKQIILNNANEYLAINLNSESMPGSELNITVEWTEE